MTLKSSFSDLLRENMKRRLWSAALSLLLFFFLYPVAALLSASRAFSPERAGTFSEDMAQEMILFMTRRSLHASWISWVSAENPLFCFLLPVTAMILSFSGFRYLQQRQQTDFFHSLPLSRTRLFLAVNLNSLLIVANKKHKLPDGYVPADLVTPDIAQTAACTMRAPAAEAIAEMARAAAEDGVYLKISSAYRGEEYQRTLYNGYSASYGTETADTISSRPGYSDHQTGLAADFVEGDGSLNGINFNQSFEDTASGQWLRVHAHEYGFIMRYAKGKQDITGYAYEPWHFRYIGVDYATAIYETDEFYTFEEYFGVEGGDYAE